MKIMKEKSYRQLEEELRVILERIEHGIYEELEDLLKDHESGMAIAAELQERLSSAKASIKKVSDK